MRKLLTCALLSGLLASTGAFAQSPNVDLAPQAIMISNQDLQPSSPLTVTPFLSSPFDTTGLNDSIPAIIVLGIDSAGGTLTADDTFKFIGPWSKLNDDGTMGFNIGYSQDGSDISADTSYALIFYLGNDWVKTTDSINTLLNINYFEANFVDSGGVGLPFEEMLYRRSELVDGQTYGWYVHARPYPEWDEADYVDNNKLNNWSYTPVIWHAGNTGIQDVLKNTHYTSINVYPNPTTDKISFKIDFESYNKSTVARILDMSGRVINSKLLGSSNAGSQTMNLDVAELPAGNYSIQIIVDRAIYVSKFVKN